MFEKLKSTFVHLLLFGLMYFGYAYYVSPVFGYDGFHWAPNTVNLIGSLCLLVFMSLLTPHLFAKPSDLLFNLLLVFSIIPMLVLCSAAGKPLAFAVAACAAATVVRVLCNSLELPYVNVRIVRNRNLLYFLGLTSVAFIGSIILLGGARFINFNLARVYEYRMEAQESLPGVYGYMSSAVGKTLVPFIMVLGIVEKRRFFVLLGAAISIMLFGLTGHKQPLFTPFLLLLIYWKAATPQSNRQFNLTVLAVLLGCVVDSYLYFNASAGGVGWTSNLFMRRAFFLPALLNFHYFDFFSHNPWVMWSESKLTLGLIRYPYGLTASHVIGEAYFDSPEMGANTGWLGCGYMHLGFYGMAVYAIAIGLLFGFIDACSRRVGKRVALVVSVVPVLSLLLSSDLTTMILTHGLLINLLLLCILESPPLQQEEGEKSSESVLPTEPALSESEVPAQSAASSGAVRPSIPLMVRT